MDSATIAGLSVAFTQMNMAVAHLLTHMSDMDEDQMDGNKLALALVALVREDWIKIPQFADNIIPMQIHRQFVRYFRMSLTTSQYLIDLVSRFHDERHAPGGRLSISLREKVLMVVNYLGSQDTGFVVANRFGVAESSFIKIKNEIMDILVNHVFPEVVKWPSVDELPEIARKMAVNRKPAVLIPNVIGSIDSTFIRISHHKVFGNKQAFYNYKLFHAVKLQAVARENLEIIDAFAGWPGRAHDANTFRGSSMYDELYERTDGYKYMLIGDKAYPISEGLMTPYTGKYEDLSQPQRDFNYSLSSVRQDVERAFGLLKKRWPRLRNLDCRTLESVNYTIQSCVILHNITLTQNDNLERFMDQEPEDPMDPGNGEGEGTGTRASAIRKRDRICEQYFG